MIERGSQFVINFPETKGNGIRSFSVKHEYAEYVRKYKKLRPANVQTDRFFLNYHNGKCTVQPVGRNKFLRTPKVIAKFLKLEDADNYTCQSLRKESVQEKERKSVDPNFEQINFEKSTETMPSSVDTSTVPNKIGEDGKSMSFDLLPLKSQMKYVSAYDKFMAWKTGEEIDKQCFSEAVMLQYFNQLKSECPTENCVYLWQE